MLSPLKKSPEKDGKIQSTAWHPNFRDFAQLPDTKVVRTSFFVNGLAALALISAATFVAYQEYTISVLNHQVQQAESRIQSDRTPSAQAIALYKKFQEEQNKFAEAEAFVKADRLVVTEFMARLAETLPRAVSLTSVDYSASGVMLRGVVRAQPDQASGIASAYETQLRKDQRIGSDFSAINLVNLAPDATTGRLNFELSMKFADAGKKP